MGMTMGNSIIIYNDGTHARLLVRFIIGMIWWTGLAPWEPRGITFEGLKALNPKAKARRVPAMSATPPLPSSRSFRNNVPPLCESGFPLHTERPPRAARESASSGRDSNKATPAVLHGSVYPGPRPPHHGLVDVG